MPIYGFGLRYLAYRGKYGSIGVIGTIKVVTPDVEVRVQRVMDDYKRLFAQQSVLRLVTNAWAGF